MIRIFEKCALFAENIPRF